MTIQDLIRLAQTRLAYLSQRRSVAESTGDAVAVSAVDAEIAETEHTLQHLQGITE